MRCNFTLMFQFLASFLDECPLLLIDLAISILAIDVSCGESPRFMLIWKAFTLTSYFFYLHINLGCIPSFTATFSTVYPASLRAPAWAHVLGTYALTMDSMKAIFAIITNMSSSLRWKTEREDIMHFYAWTCDHSQYNKLFRLYISASIS